MDEYKLNKPLFEGVSRFSGGACEWRRRVDFRFFWLLLAMLPRATGSSLQRGKRYPQWGDRALNLLHFPSNGLVRCYVAKIG